jgi:hypothetical protein
MGARSPCLVLEGRHLCCQTPERGKGSGLWNPYCIGNRGKDGYVLVVKVISDVGVRVRWPLFAPRHSVDKHIATHA